nr:immunoglobulin light chain junction region [Macaca mulatta]MOX89545.1 immunoglobulin light chain junction region [Macaca mulatta]MOX90781.1 immunoglobulin light chain junction region [Macaca mulatta]MOX90998.1 immunoglobulin light chain junction region [Macaca mulatta]MOX91209.1 immunoglobulin light chain junction region [Macaca mulatta]
CLQDVHLPPTF